MSFGTNIRWGGGLRQGVVIVHDSWVKKGRKPYSR